MVRTKSEVLLSAIAVALLFLILYNSWKPNCSNSIKICDIVPQPIPDTGSNRYVDNEASNSVIQYKESSKYIDFLHLCTVLEPGNCTRLFDGMHSYTSKYRLAAKYNLVACPIEKSMSTLMTGVFCYLHNNEAFEKANRSIKRESYPRRFCMGKNELQNLAEVRSLIPKASFVTVVRDPIERFLSGFTDKCIKQAVAHPKNCYSCNGDMSCFINKLYQNLMKPKFGNREKSMEEVHFSPQNWHCNFHSTLYEYKVLKYGASGVDSQRMIAEFSEIFRSSGVPEHLIRRISEELSGGESVHTTRGSPARWAQTNQLSQNPDLMKLLVKIYYYDYFLFGFKFPVVYAN